MPPSDPALRPFHPIVRRWFAETLGSPSAPQREGWPAIARGEHTLVLAPTGTGKTLAAFLWELNALIVEGERGPLPNAVQILYISPLKALNNDVQRNLERPLAEIEARFIEAGRTMPEIRVAVRTGDTPASARARMVRKTPHVLITTPESLHILLTSVRARTMLAGVRAVIVDEIHAVAGTKRGAHLALTLERLDELCLTSAGAGRAPQRIGLSATQRPLDEVARFLGGLSAVPAGEPARQAGIAAGSAESGESTAAARGAPPEHHDTPERRLEPHHSSVVVAETTQTGHEGASGDSPATQTAARAGADVARFRHVTIVDCGLVKTLETSVVSPVADLASVGGTVWPAVADLVLRYVRRANTTLVFVNNRAQAERIAARVNALAGEEVAQPYHGSLARERRFALELALKAGELRALVTTSSLELGIDVGSVDLVLQLQSPKRVSAALQRIGRAGHSLGAVSRGVFVPTFRDDAIEIAAIVAAVRAAEVEPTRVVQNALDVLAQVIVAAAAVDDRTADDLYALARRSYSYHRLTRAAFDEVLAMLSGKYPSDLAAELEARLTWDRTTGRVSAPRASRMSAVISGGTIPDRGMYAVHLPDKTRLGELDEEFVHESRVGDVFQLGSSTWRVAAIEHDRVVVHPAPGVPARMPFWHGEFMARPYTLSARVGGLRRALVGATTLAALREVAEQHGCDEATATTLAEYVAQQRAATGVVPDERTLVIEHFRDETGSVRIVIHTPFGGRVHAPWGMALAARVREALTRGDTVPDVQVQTSDDGIMLRLPDLGSAPPLHALLELTVAEAEQRVVEEVGGTSLFGARFRMNAARALLLARGNPRRRMPLWLQRLKALDLLQAVRQFPSFPLLVETYREVLQDAFDVAGMREVLGAIAERRIAVRVVETQMPSPFAASLQFGFMIDWLYGDDTPRAEQRAALLSLDRALLDEVMGAEGADDGTLEEIDRLLGDRRGTAPGRRARTADELAHLLDRAGDLAPDELAARVALPDEGRRGDPVRELLGGGRAIAVRFTASAAGGPPHRDDAVGAPEVHHQFDAWRIILTESYGRYLAAFGGRALARVRAGAALVERDAADVVPEPLRQPAVTRGAARREILARYVALAGPVTVEGTRARYPLRAAWIESLFTEWQRTGRLVRGYYRDRTVIEWCARRVVEAARRRALATLRRQIQAVELPVFAGFLQRWQRIDPRDRMGGAAGLSLALRQLSGLARPATAWERDYLPARVGQYEPAWLSQLAASGEIVWAGAGTRDESSGALTLARLRFFERGTGAIWLEAEPGSDAPAPLSEAATRVRQALERGGASFFGDLQAAAGLGAVALRDALRELVAAGLATNDSAEGMREVVRLKPLPPRAEGGAAPDPTRWLPAGFVPGQRPVVQRRSNLRKLPKWKRPDRDGGGGAWVGRWSLVRTPGVMGPDLPDEERAEAIARQWLDRYGVVSRDWWRRERPPVAWREIYRQLKRLEMRGDVRRGYFVRGLAGAQFALPEAVEQLRLPPDENAPLVVLATSDPANPYSLPLDGADRDPLSRPRGAGAQLVMRGGRVVMAVEGRGARLSVAPGISAAEVTAAADALAAHTFAIPSAARRGRDLIVRTIDGRPATTSAHTDAFLLAGYRRDGSALRRYE